MREDRRMDGRMKLTVAEIGVDEYKKAERDRAWFRSTPAAAKGYARERGNYCREQMMYATLPDALGNLQRDAHFYRFQQDAVMFARNAFRGWRAYRLMVGE